MSNTEEMLMRATLSKIATC